MRAYERLLQYVKIYTTSEESSQTTPSTARQLDLAKFLVEEMNRMGVGRARVDEKGYVYGEIPACPGCENAPTIGFIAHMDTAPDFCGENVHPVVIQDYDGGDVVLGESGRVLSVKNFSHLPGLKGRTLITTDGTTLLGADDKAGIAEILTMAEELLHSNDTLEEDNAGTESIDRGNPLEGFPVKETGNDEALNPGDSENKTGAGFAHGKICLAFTPDEEIGRGADEFDVPGFGADFAYTVDGGAENEIEFENFNAAAAKVEIRGFSVHPGSSKDTMINAALVAMEFNSMLPSGDTPRDTEGYEGFYHLHTMSGDVSEATLEYIVRDHSAAMYDCRLETLRHITKLLNEKYGENTVTLTIREQYRNMREQIEGCMHLIDNAKKAAQTAGLSPVTVPIRGGTDGARLSFMGLPCPNLGTGGYAFHGPYEHITAEGMDAVVRMLKEIVRLYGCESHNNLMENIYVMGNKANYDWLMESKRQPETYSRIG
ncbi:MAG: peptidase T [Lachnospiraceae bacterium]|nr:peptidase T [Lachnospiraceae bacterium]